MNDILGKAKSAVKLLGSASVEMMIGGIVTAVIPANVSVVYWATIGPKERVPACSNCIVLAIKAENAAKS